MFYYWIYIIGDASYKYRINLLTIPYKCIEFTSIFLLIVLLTKKIIELEFIYYYNRGCFFICKYIKIVFFLF